MTVTDTWAMVPTLRGQHVTLQPLQQGHVDGLRAALEGSGLDRLWYTQVPAPAQAGAYVQAALQAQAEGRVLPFVIRDAAGDIVGSTRFYDLDAAVPRLSLGYTWYAPRAQRTGANTEAKLLLLQHAFEVMGCISVVLETSWFNTTSRTAIARLGAKQDGVLRNHKRHADGTPRDTVIFSIIDAEWQGVKRHLQYRLDSHA
ncbi:GNAT family N-acetyltransferase [Stenotrophomonas maltophilia]|jgi:RimJ/RimL family protein N-acetyltransferase|uniref:GNAT family N-acetyltransferase n=1 Tax=Stenotrophomonas maltophilia TaxID=40324 RepID=UPI000DA9517C|nr:GNAT family protein [Stenotrophomonas maltophilia]MCO7399766.1 GNAT family N-acetyltransferase [Stenotrophomonas maltophilia]MCO7411596.1 GNAT family N-acetyltransferase [Stenotrophomonas maltophilia]MDZ5843317.1 GNAT family protein [Stenotrophomonas maltophilia]PZT30741.1 acetyltransferase [Stenotrophomonas maltophilia]HDS1648584.1 GNAT family N-acetyltransferase [Stenotrophomonas maltophilia]